LQDVNARNKKNLPKVDPDFLEKQKASLVRTQRQVLYFNEKEMNAIDEYCRILKIQTRSSFYRKAIMQTVLEGLDENHPTLFEQEQ